jgi:hypothetical protein
LSETREKPIGFKLRVAVKDKITGEEKLVWEDIVSDPATQQMAQIFQALFLNTAQSSSVKDTGGTSRSVAAQAAASAPTVVAGSGGTTAAVTDYKLGFQVSGNQGSQPATPGSISGWSGSTGSFTITANMAAPSSGTIVYTEVGITITIGGYVFLIARYYYSSGWSVGTTNYLAITYTAYFGTTVS